jgi:hypothetical protein
LPNCAKWYYEISETKIVNVTAAVSLNFVTSYDYMIIEEAYSWTFETFIGALGGILGMWLGLDFSVLLEFFFNPMMVVLRRCLSKQGKILNTTVSDQFHYKIT